MGLDTYTNDKSEITHIHISYSTFNYYRYLVAKSYDEKLGIIYKKIIRSFIDGQTYSIEEEKYYETILSKNKGIELLLQHSDCDGTLNYKECEIIREEIIELTLENDGSAHDYNGINNKFIKAFEYCYKHRMSLHFS